MSELKKLQENGVDIYPVTLEDVVFDSDGNSISTKYQTKTDNTLNTTDKTIVGAINELFQSGTNAKQNLVDTLVAKGISASTSMTFDELINLINDLGGGDSNNLPSWCDNGVWIEAINFGQKVAHSDSCVIGNNIYIVGGMVDVSDSTGVSGDTDFSKHCDYYRTDTNTNDYIGNMPTARYGLGVESVGNYVYAIGGYNGTYEKRVERTNGVNINHEWETKTEMPSASAYFGSATINNKIYCIAGKSPNVKSINMCYDVATDTWSMKALIPIAKKELTASAVGNCIYCVGGRDDSNDVLNSNHCYDTLTDTWSSKSNMIRGSFGLTSSAVNDCVYCIGGANGVRLSNNQCYDTNTDTWSSKTILPDTLMYLTSEAVNGFIYVIGGENSSQNYLNTNYCYILK